MDDVSLTVEPGQFVVLLGPSGCGKTTLLKLVNRLYNVTAGRILIDDEPIDSLPAPILRRKIGYVIQQTGLFPHMRVEDNIAVVPKLLKWDKRRISQRIDELLHLVGLPPDEYRKRYPTQLSGGQQQRIGLARALAADPSTMLMDEPFGAIDAITRTRLQDELKRIHSTLGQTILFVTHDVEEAVRLADRIVVMHEGKVAQYDTASRIVLKPANEFVASLIGSGDVLRRLSLIRVEAAFKPFDRDMGRIEPPEPTVTLSDDLRTALSGLLESDLQELIVLDADGNPVGTIDMDAIHRQSTALESELRAATRSTVSADLSRTE